MTLKPSFRAFSVTNLISVVALTTIYFISGFSIFPILLGERYHLIGSIN